MWHAKRPKLNVYCPWEPLLELRRVFITRLDGGIKNAYTSKVLDYYSNDDVSYIVLFSKRNTALAQRP